MDEANVDSLEQSYYPNLHRGAKCVLLEGDSMIARVVEACHGVASVCSAPYFGTQATLISGSSPIRNWLKTYWNI